MLFLTIVKVALKSLLANKLRSLLAMLGIIIGVGAVISMLALGAGAQQQVMERIGSMGTNLLIVRPAQRGSGGVMSGTAQSLTVADALAIVEELPEVRQVAPVVSGSVQAKYLNKNSRTSVLGTAETYLPIRGFELERGRMFTEIETDRMARVAVLGPSTVENLFGAEDPLEKVIKLNGINFRVLGVLKAKGDQGWANPDDQIVLPYTTAMKQVLGQERLREIDVQVVDGVDLAVAERSVGALLRQRHRLQPEAEDDFQIRNQAEILEAASSVSRTFTILLGGIASISLLVGGIGIMNIMLVTVTERTREIGVRKAIGAKERDILRQFLIESILMSGLGGLLGVGVGIGGAAVVSRLTEFGAVVQIQSVLVSLSFSAAVGVFFGYYPARRAAQLDTIDALRYE
jgi:putative ABC transport system permease protein